MYSDRFQRSMPFIFKWEGYGNNAVAGDAGGWTIWGISQNSHPAEVEKMKTMDKEASKEVAKDIYWNKYWLALKPMGIDLDAQNLPPKMALAIFDTGVNMGITASVNLYTIAQRPDPQYTFNNFLLERINKYNDIVLARPVNSKFMAGWLARVFDLRTFAV